MRFNKVTPLMHRRRLPVSVRARGCVTLPAFRVLWLWVSRAIGPMVWLIYSGVLVVIARWTAQMVWYSANSSARSQPSCWMTSEMWSLRLRPLTTRAQKFRIFCTRAICVTPQDPYTLMQYRTIDITSACTIAFRVFAGIT